jgi:hypothetical protein
LSSTNPISKVTYKKNTTESGANVHTPPQGGQPSGAQIFCPVCGILVRLPAIDCPQCHANLRTGEKPEEYVPLWKRGKGKLLLIFLIIGLPSLGWNILSNRTEEGLYPYLKAKLSLESCADAKDMWDDFDQQEFESQVKGGNWAKNGEKRKVGQSATGPETPEQAARTESQKILDNDSRAYFASSLMSTGPSSKLKNQDNWYVLFPGEWDIAYITGAGTNDEKILAGEWTFVWINDGQALQDVMSVPYRWQDAPSGVTPIQSTSTRVFNPKYNVWDGFHIIDNQLIFFRAAKDQGGKIVEHYQMEGGPLILTRFSDFTATSFKATISKTTDNGATYTKIADITAKKRNVFIP